MLIGEGKIVSPKLRIAFTGSSCSGKTENCNYLINKYKFRHTYINQTRWLIEKKYDGELELARKENVKFQNLLLKRKIYWENQHQRSGFVTDRTTLDNAAYYLSFSGNESIEAVTNYLTKAITHAKKAYDLIIFLSPILNAPEDPLSPRDPLYQLKIHYIILGLLTVVEKENPNLVKYVYIQDREQRQVIMDNFIQEKLQEI